MKRILNYLSLSLSISPSFSLPLSLSLYICHICVCVWVCGYYHFFVSLNSVVLLFISPVFLSFIRFVYVYVYVLYMYILLPVLFFGFAITETNFIFVSEKVYGRKKICVLSFRHAILFIHSFIHSVSVCVMYFLGSGHWMYPKLISQFKIKTTTKSFWS